MPNLDLTFSSAMGTVHAREAPPPGSSSPPSTTRPLDSISAQVVRVHFEGVGRTKEDVLVGNVRPIFDVRHFEDLVLKAQDARNSLRELGCFSEVDVHIDTSSAAGASAQDYEVTFRVTELRRMVGSINTMVGNQEGSLLTGLRMPNLLGRGERLQLDHTYGTRRTSAFNASLVKPVRGRARTNVSGSIFQQMAEFPPSGFKELNRGALVDVSFVSAPQISHNLQWEGAWRQLNALNRLDNYFLKVLEISFSFFRNWSIYHMCTLNSLYQDLRLRRPRAVRPLPQVVPPPRPDGRPP